MAKKSKEQAKKENLELENKDQELENAADENDENIELEEIGDDYLPDTERGDILAFWEFPEFEKHQRGKIWWIIFSVVFVGMLLYSYFSDNFLFALILVIAAILYFSINRHEPEMVEFAITEDGIFVGRQFVEYSDIREFYIIYYPPEIKKLYFETKSNFKQRIVIPLEDMDPVYIREVLLNYLEENIKKEELPASDSISKLLKL